MRWHLFGTYQSLFRFDFECIGCWCFDYLRWEIIPIIYNPVTIAIFSYPFVCSRFIYVIFVPFCLLQERCSCLVISSMCHWFLLVMCKFVLHLSLAFCITVLEVQVQPVFQDRIFLLDFLGFWWLFVEHFQLIWHIFCTRVPNLLTHIPAEALREIYKVVKTLISAFMCVSKFNFWSNMTPRYFSCLPSWILCITFYRSFMK